MYAAQHAAHHYDHFAGYGHYPPRPHYPVYNAEPHVSSTPEYYNEMFGTHGRGYGHPGFENGEVIDDERDEDTGLDKFAK